MLGELEGGSGWRRRLLEVGEGVPVCRECLRVPRRGETRGCLLFVVYWETVVPVVLRRRRATAGALGGYQIELLFFSVLSRVMNIQQANSTLSCH